MLLADVGVHRLEKSRPSNPYGLSEWIARRASCLVAVPVPLGLLQHRLSGRTQARESATASEEDCGGQIGRVHSTTSDDRSTAAALHKWRDAVAREEDESTGHVLPRKLLARVATGLPASVPALRELVGPGAKVVLRRAAEVLAVIAAAQQVAAWLHVRRHVFCILTLRAALCCGCSSAATVIRISGKGYPGRRIRQSGRIVKIRV